MERSALAAPVAAPAPVVLRRFPGRPLLLLLRRLYLRVRLDDAERSEGARRAARMQHGLMLGGVFGPADEMSRGDDHFLR